MKSRDGATAFARYYVSLINHAQATGDTRPLKAVELATCASCGRGRQYIDRVYSQGGSIQGGALKVTSSLAAANPQTGGWNVTLGVRFGPQRIDWADPKADEDLKGGQLPMNLQVVRRGGTWKVLEWSRGA